MNVQISPFQLQGCRCRLKFDPKELQTLLDDELKKKMGKKAKQMDQIHGDLSIGGAFTEIDEGNFALHFMLAFIGKAWIAGRTHVTYNGSTLIDEPFHINKTFAAFTSGRGQLKGDIKFLADQIVKNTTKTLKTVA